MAQASVTVSTHIESRTPKEPYRDSFATASGEIGLMTVAFLIVLFGVSAILELFPPNLLTSALILTTAFGAYGFSLGCMDCDDIRPGRELFAGLSTSAWSGAGWSFLHYVGWTMGGQFLTSTQALLLMVFFGVVAAVRWVAHVVRCDDPDRYTIGAMWNRATTTSTSAGLFFAMLWLFWWRGGW